MLKKKWFKILLIIFTPLFLCLTTGIVIRLLQPTDEEKLAYTMTFEVEIPANTFEEDTVHLYTHTQDHYKMQRTGDRLFSITLTKEQLQPFEEDNAEKIKYRYSRNGFDFNTAEYLEPDTNDYFWTQLGRTTTFEKGKVQKDKVERWRWFPEEGTPIVSTTDIDPTGTFLPRINNIEFASGQVIEDLYDESYDDFFDTTAKHLVETGYKWVELDPPWQWREVDGKLEVVNLYEENPNYPNDEKFREEIRAYKNAGLKVRIQPQICCTEISMKNKSQEWWNQYFAETEKFLLHFAKIAEEENVDGFHYAVGSGETAYTDNWRQIFRNIKSVYSGEVGQMVWNFGTYLGQIIPTAEEIKWGSELDYFYIAIAVPISLKDDATDAELKKGADTMLDGVKSLYNKFHKPVIVRTTYFNIKQTWKGVSFYEIGDVPWCNAEEKELIGGKYEFDNDDQARTVNAFFRSIAERPWITGYGQFGYSHWTNPLCAELSVRGKPSEDVWKKWNEKIY